MQKNFFSSKSYKTIIIVLSLVLFNAALFSFVGINEANAFAKQPPGQLPITEPLRSIDPDIQPNYSNNIQDDESTASNIPVYSVSEQPLGASENTNSDAVTPIDDPSNQIVDGSNSNKKWLIILIVVVLIVLIGIFVWRKFMKARVVSMILVIFVPGALSLGFYKNVLAQSLPPNNTPIQRTIIAEEDILTDTAQASSRASGTVFYGLGAIYYAPNGTVLVSNNAGAYQVTGNTISLSNNSVISYQSGLASATFSNGPGGSWAKVDGTYFILE